MVMSRFAGSTFFFELKAGALPDHIRRRRNTKFIQVVIT